jgi:hypothetical protein
MTQKTAQGQTPAKPATTSKKDPAKSETPATPVLFRDFASI